MFTGGQDVHPRIFARLKSGAKPTLIALAMRSSTGIPATGIKGTKLLGGARNGNDFRAKAATVHSLNWTPY